MPISDKYKTIFVHIPKTGGQSINRMLELEAKKEHLISVTEPILQHILPAEIKKRIPAKKWNTYYKFTIIRNPYEKCLSDFLWFKFQFCPRFDIPVTTFGETFQKHLEYRKNIVNQGKYTGMFDNHFIPMVDYLKDIDYDKICRFENLTEDIEDVKKHINNTNELKKINATNHTNYQSYYDDTCRQLVEEMYGEDIKYFGYSFD